MGWGVWLAYQLCMKDDSLTKNLKSGWVWRSAVAMSGSMGLMAGTVALDLTNTQYPSRAEEGRTDEGF